MAERKVYKPEEKMKIVMEGAERNNLIGRSVREI